ncbi:hypothetical protein C7M84_022674 [Penaeus vannamei]|uniref:Uncharacterized protein n=1 Tax=Penaeus vannamei TaxID=6689 RepID=A0A3R7MRL8_PENVA|nr:hypothetical protein C7M84_022674 [Penaeus vannamei]
MFYIRNHPLPLPLPSSHSLPSPFIPSSPIPPLPSPPFPSPFFPPLSSPPIPLPPLLPLFPLAPPLPFYFTLPYSLYPLPTLLSTFPSPIPLPSFFHSPPFHPPILPHPFHLPHSILPCSPLSSTLPSLPPSPPLHLPSSSLSPSFPLPPSPPSISIFPLPPLPPSLPSPSLSPLPSSLPPFHLPSPPSIFPPPLPSSLPPFHLPSSPPPPPTTWLSEVAERTRGRRRSPTCHTRVRALMIGWLGALEVPRKPVSQPSGCLLSTQGPARSFSLREDAADEVRMKPVLHCGSATSGAQTFGGCAYACVGLLLLCTCGEAVQGLRTCRCLHLRLNMKECVCAGGDGAAVQERGGRGRLRGGGVVFVWWSGSVVAGVSREGCCGAQREAVAAWCSAVMLPCGVLVQECRPCRLSYRLPRSGHHGRRGSGAPPPVTSNSSSPQSPGPPSSPCPHPRRWSHRPRVALVYVPKAAPSALPPQPSPWAPFSSPRASGATHARSPTPGTASPALGRRGNGFPGSAASSPVSGGHSRGSPSATPNPTPTPPLAAPAVPQAASAAHGVTPALNPVSTVSSTLDTTTSSTSSKTQSTAPIKAPGTAPINPGTAQSRPNHSSNQPQPQLQSRPQPQPQAQPNQGPSPTAPIKTPIKTPTTATGTAPIKAPTTAPGTAPIKAPTTAPATAQLQSRPQPQAQAQAQPQSQPKARALARPKAQPPARPPQSSRHDCHYRLEQGLRRSPRQSPSLDPRPPPPHRLIRQHSLAAVLGLFRGRDERGIGGEGGEHPPEDWPTVREEPEELERSSSSNNSRSHSIPSTSVPHLPQDARRKRRSSCHTDMTGSSLAGGGFPLIPHLPHAIKKKPLANEAAAAAITTRRCSLTLPYATLYGSWQSTGSAPGSRHGSNEMPSGGPPAARRGGSGPSVTVEMTHMGGAGGASSGPAASTIANSCYVGISSPVTISSGKVPMKDFGSEVRASMDIAHFLSQATLVLDVVETSLEGITDLLLTKLLEKDEPLCSVAEAKSILFTHDTCKYPLTCMPLPFA